MVRKRIGDLLREEAKEPVAREDAPVNEENNHKTQQDNEVKEELPPVNIPATKSRRSTATTTTAQLRLCLIHQQHICRVHNIIPRVTQHSTNLLDTLDAHTTAYEMR